jgi:hypothetical protein
VPITFQEIFSPTLEREVLEGVFGQCALHIPGASGKFEALPSWQTLNRLLRFGNLTYPRLRLTTRDSEIPAAAFSVIGSNGHSRLRVREVTAALRAGAVLVIEAIEQLDDAVDQLCHCLEDRINVPAQADLYAICRGPSTKQFLTNDYELLIVQLSGENRCELRAADGRGHRNMPEPRQVAEGPVWIGQVTQGDVLYAPKGSSLRIETGESPSVYLAVRFHFLTGVDVVRYFTKDLERSDALAVSYPASDALAPTSFLELIVSEVSEVVGKAGLVLGCVRDTLRRAEPRSRFGLPWSARANPLPQSDDQVVIPLIRFLRSDALVPSEIESSVELFHDGRMLRFRSEVTRIFECLSGVAPSTVGAVVQQCAPFASREQVLTSLAELVMNGVISVE